ncbi:MULTISPECIES: dimethylamine monooxygenase subunit DmmA family protein [unclassified Gordonia (in: high G+C Gram-positive bacteria)]
MSQIAYSSVPLWARPAATASTGLPDATGTSYVLVGVGESEHSDAADIVRSWIDALPEDAERHVILADVAGAATELRSILTHATVGLRLLIAGPVGACLRLRAEAVRAGLEDDEIHVVPTSAGQIDVFCSHCRTVTTTPAAVDDTIECSGCGRTLLVYYHVSRRTGAYLGFMIDAETAAPQQVLQENTK